MAVERVTSQQFAQAIKNAILTLNKSYDTEMGPIPDLVINPVSAVLSQQNASIRQLQQLLALVQDGSYTYDDLVAFVANEGVYPSTGAKAVVNLVFSASVIQSDVTVSSGFPVSTQVDELSQQSVTYVTLEQVVLRNSQKASYYNAVTQRYELVIPAIATVGGAIGNVASNRITRPLRSLVGFTNVFNRDPAQGGMDGTTEAQLVERYLIAIVGTSQSVESGTRRLALDIFPNVRDVAIVYGYDPLLTRAGTDAGAVDEWVLGEANLSRVDASTFTARGIPIPMLKQPVQSVTSVQQGAQVYVQGVDYNFVKDTSGNSNSTRGTDSIVFTFSGTAPVANSSVVINYVQNVLIEDMQATYESPANFVFGRDLLVRQSVPVPVQISAGLTVGLGLSYASVSAQVETAILAFVNSLLLNARIPGVSPGGSLQMSDVNAVVRKIAGVDNFVISVFSVVGGSGAQDIPVGKNQNPTLNVANLSIVSL